MKKLLLLILPILLCIFGININVNADSESDGWYIPNLEEYTFNIPRNSEDFIFKRHDFNTGNFVGFLNRQNDFGVSQNSNGELGFNSFQQTLLRVAQRSVEVSGGGGGGGGVSRYGLTPLITNSLPSYVTYNIYNTLDRSLYKGAVDRHVITYRLDFLGNYSMLLDENIYDIVYSLEIKFELLIYYFDMIDSFELIRGYTIHWYDTTEMEEYRTYTLMDSNLLQFQLFNIAESEGWNAGYDEGHNDGYNEGYEVGYDVGYDVGFEVAQPKMDILLITLIMFLLSIFIYFKFRIKWVLIATILLWFVPIFLVENLFIKIFSVIMILVTITITFFNNREEDIE